MVKSVGNSTTPPHDITSVREGKVILYLLVENVAERLRSLGFKAKQVSISARGTDLISHGCQRVLQAATDGTAQIAMLRYSSLMSVLRGIFPLEAWA